MLKMCCSEVLTMGSVYLLAFIVILSFEQQYVNAEAEQEPYYKEFVMPGVTPRVHDAYVCSPKSLRTGPGPLKDEWIIRYDPLASANRAHHMLLYACSGLNAVAVGKTHWDCGHHGVCKNGRVIYAWAKNAPATQLPENVGFEIGGDTGITHLVLQIHYAKPLAADIKDHSGLKMLISTKKQKYHAGIYLLLSPSLDIPPNTAVTHADMNCKLRNDLNIFAYRVHAHALGVVIRGYQYQAKTKKLVEIAKGNPHWPQAFYPMDHVHKVKTNDILHARCTFNSTGRDRHTYIGSTAADEMCNLYLMYYTEKDPSKIDSLCYMETFPQITRHLPADSDKALPSNPLLEESTKGENKNKNKTVTYDKAFKNPHNSIFKPTRVILDPPQPRLASPMSQLRTFKMPGVTPKRADSYMCTSMLLDASQEEWVTRFDPLASANRAHHMLLYACEDVDPRHATAGHWDCLHHGVCKGGQVMYAWAKNAPSTSLPPDVGFRIGGQSSVKYLVLQIHYANALPDTIKDQSGLQMQITHKAQKYMAGIYVLAAMSVDIPPHTKKTHADMNCVVGEEEPADINLFAYRVHAHKLGSVITGYQISKETTQVTEIAKGNPHWPQAFYPMDKIHSVKRADILMARCTFNSMNSTKHTHIGPTANDEMCNLYLMYYTDPQTGSSTGVCQIETYDLEDVIPVDSDVPLPPNPLLEHMSGGQNSNTDKEVTYSDLFPSKPIELQKKTHVKKQPQDDKYRLKPKPVQPFAGYNPSVHPDSALFKTPKHKQIDHLPKELTPIDKEARTLETQYHLIKDWGPSKYTLGQVTAVALDSRGDVVVFHRGDTVWDGRTFAGNNLRDSSHPIAQATLLHLQKDTGHVMHEWGANFFYMPHGLTIDNEDNIWVTDVGMHQVFKFPSGFGEGKPLLTLGKRFESGSDDDHFCKPTGVVVMSNAEFFVSDGYCNSRILHFSAEGKLIKQLNTARQRGLSFGQLNVPHALTLAEDKGEVCVADRENGRVLCFFTKNFNLSRQFKFAEWGQRLFSMVYTKAQGGKILAVNGPQFFGGQVKVLVFQADFNSGRLEAAFSPYNQGLSNPHDIACSENGSEIYIAEIGPNRVWKFSKGSSKNTTIHNGTNVQIKTGQLKAGFSNKLNLFAGQWSSTGVSSIILALLAIPILVLATLAIIIRCRKRGSRHRYMENGKLGSDVNGKHKTGLTLGSLLNKHHGFERVPNSDIDCQDDLDSQDSEIEEFSATKV